MTLDDDANEDNNETLFPGEAVIETDDEAVDDGELFKMEVMLKDLIECECRASGFAPFDQRKSHAARCGEPATSSQCLEFQQFQEFQKFQELAAHFKRASRESKSCQTFQEFQEFQEHVSRGFKTILKFVL